MRWIRCRVTVLKLGAFVWDSDSSGTEVLDEQRRLVVAQWVGKLQAFRITLTPPVLNHADNVIFLVSGGDKAEVLRGAYSPKQYPAQLIRPNEGRLLWLVDRAAAALL